MPEQSQYPLFPYFCSKFSSFNTLLSQMRQLSLMHSKQLFLQNSRQHSRMYRGTSKPHNISIERSRMFDNGDREAGEGSPGSPWSQKRQDFHRSGNSSIRIHQITTCSQQPHSFLVKQSLMVSNTHFIDKTEGTCTAQQHSSAKHVQ